MNGYYLYILLKSIDSIFHRFLPSLSARDDLGDLFKFKFFDDLLQAVIHILLANYQEDGADKGTGLKFVKGMGEDGFPLKEVELFLLPLHEAMSLSSGDDNGVGLHGSIGKIWNNGVVE
jgi:hypothetical protein